MIPKEEQSKVTTVCTVELLKFVTYRNRQMPNYQISHIIKQYLHWT